MNQAIQQRQLKQVDLTVPISLLILPTLDSPTGILEKEVAPHSSILAWRIPWREEPGTPVLLPGKSHGWRSLEGCSPWGR